jgi:hypothetical protein
MGLINKLRVGWGLVSLLILGVVVACGAPSTPAPPSATPTVTPLPTWTPVPTPVPDVLFVDAGAGRGAISPYVYGTNTGPWSFVTLELMPLAEEAGITFLRFPGGNYGDQHDLRPLEIDRFITLCEQLGAEPSISARLRGGTPEQAAELVRYTNVEQGYGVRYWGIGNEPGLYDDYDTERYNQEWRAVAEAMLAVDDEIVLLGPEVTQWTGNPTTDPRDEDGRDWVREFLLHNGDLVDVVALHRYPFPTEMGATGVASREALMANPPEWDEIIPNLRALIEETTGRRLPVAITEVNSHWNSALGGEATPDSHASAIWWGDVLGRLIRHDVEIVAHFALQSPSSMGGWGLFARYEARPAYYVYRMYQHFGGERLHATSDTTLLSVYAAEREDGALTVMIINRAAEEREETLQIASAPTPSDAEVWRFDVDHQAENIGTLSLNEKTEITLPAESMTLLVLPPDN